MARPREFDQAAVLEAASDIFWAKGYEATSTRDLAARTGLTPSSMYAAFGDKRGLFRQALGHYLDRLRDKMAALEGAPSPALAISGFFDDTIERILADVLQRGCMLVNAAIEVSPEDTEFRGELADELTLIETFFRNKLLEAQDRGEVSRDLSASGAAQQLLAVLIGIRVLARVRPERALLTGAAEHTLGLLGLPALVADAAPRPLESRVT